MGGGNQADTEYIQRMQKAENVNQILSKVLRDVISKHPVIADEVRKGSEHIYNKIKSLLPNIDTAADLGDLGF